MILPGSGLPIHALSLILVRSSFTNRPFAARLDVENNALCPDSRTIFVVFQSRGRSERFDPIGFESKPRSNRPRT